MARKTKKRKPQGQSQAAAPQGGAVSRRAWLQRAAVYGLGGAVILGGGGAFALDVRRKLIEQDLSVLGQSTPVVLQIHDPQCPICSQLQRETRRALRAFPDEAVHYRFANIRTPQGLAVQAREGLPHASLALYCGRGERLHVVEGVTPSAELVATFQRTLRLPLKA